MSHCTRSRCPNCGGAWETTDEMPQVLLKGKKAVDLEQAEEMASAEGWTPKNKKKYGTNVVGVPYNGVITQWSCMLCGELIDEATGKVV